MSAYEVTDAVIERIGSYDVIILNYANCDMVGHTGIFDAAVQAVETVDACVGRVIDAVLRSVSGTGNSQISRLRCLSCLACRNQQG